MLFRQNYIPEEKTIQACGHTNTSGIMKHYKICSILNTSKKTHLKINLMFLVKLSYLYLHLSPFRLFTVKNTEFDIKGYSNIFSYLLLAPQKCHQNPPNQTAMQNSIWLLVWTIFTSPVINAFKIHLHESQVQQEIHF